MMRNRTLLSPVALLAGFQMMAPGAEPRAPDARLVLPELVREALDNNPEIRAAEQRIEVARAVIPQVRTLPDPTINFGYRDLSDREMMYGATQEIPFPDKLRLRGEVAAREADRAQQEYLATRLRIIARLKEAYYDLHLVHKSIEILEKNKVLLKDFEKTARVRYAVGDAAQQDVFRAQAEVSRVLGRLAGFRQRKESSYAELNRLLNRPAAAPLGLPGEVTLSPRRRSLDDITALISRLAPRLRAQMKGVERGNQALALARREYLPDFELSALGLHEEPMAEEGYEIMLGVRVPLYYATRQRQGVKEALAGREQATEELQAVKQELEAQVKDNVAQAERSEELVRLLKEAIIPQARLTLASARAGYAVGRVDFLTLLNSLLTLQENELELHGEIVEHEKALARLEEIIGEAP